MPRSQVNTEEHAPDGDPQGGPLDWPLGPAWVSASWREEPGAVPPLVFVVVTRRAPDARLLAAVAAVDRTCIGVRSAAVFEPMWQAELDELLTALLQDEHPFEECETELAQSILFHAIDYARSLGFEPHPDFAEPLFGPRPEELQETPSAHPHRPVYVVGARDAVEDVVAHLESVVGAGNYDVVDMVSCH